MDADQNRLIPDSPVGRTQEQDTDAILENDNYPPVDPEAEQGFAPSDTSATSGGGDLEGTGDRTPQGSGTWGMGGTGYGRGTDTSEDGGFGQGAGTSPGSYGSGGSNDQ